MNLFNLFVIIYSYGHILQVRFGQFLPSLGCVEQRNTRRPALVARMVSGDHVGDQYRDRHFGRESSNEDMDCHRSATTISDRRRRPLERWERRLRDAKKSHRPRLRDWERGRFGIEGSRSAAAFEALAWNADSLQGTRGMPRERRDELSSEEFWEHYESRRVPVVVSGIPSHEGWKAGERWTFDRLYRR